MPVVRTKPVPPMPTYADPNASDTKDLPWCACPARKGEDGAELAAGRHTNDSVTFRTQLGGGERQSIATAGYGQSLGDFYDFEAAESMLVATATLDWSLEDHLGPLPITFETCHRRLPAPIRAQIATWINEAHTEQIKAEQALLPKASGERSPASRRPTRSRTRATPSQD